MKIAILDHDVHALYIEDIDDDLLRDKYNGSEQDYIDYNYDLQNYSWDYITDATYYTQEGGSLDINLNFEEAISID